MKQKLLISLTFTIFFLTHSLAQMTDNGNTLYGNEWINYTQQYCKIPVSKDGIYRITTSELTKFGVPANTIKSTQYQLFHLGKEVPLYVTTQNTLGINDYLEFFGKKNRTELDRYLFPENPDTTMINLKYSLFNDTAAYFLTWTNTAPTNPLRYEVADNNITNAPTKLGFFQHTIDTLFTSDFDKEFTTKVSPDFLMYSHFVKAEGFASSYRKNSTIGISLEDPVPSGRDVTIGARIGWRSLLKVKTGNIGVDYRHVTNIDVNNTNYIVDTTFHGNKYGVKSILFSIPASSFSNTINNISFNSVGGTQDDHRLAHISVSYDRAFKFGQLDYFAFKLNAAPNKQYIEIENIDPNKEYIIYDITNNLRYIGKSKDKVVAFAFPASTQPLDLIFYNPNSKIEIPIKKITKFTDYGIKQPNYLLVSHASLFNDINGKNWVQEYADYRASSQGGSYKTQVVDINQVYDQFGYGVERHNIALKNFTQYAVSKWAAKYMLLLGRAITYDECRKPLDYIQGSIYTVPTYGFPGADNLIATSGHTNRPTIAIGRIPVFNANDIRIYLDKIKGIENVQKTAAHNIEERIRMKRFIQLLGGNGDASIQFIGNWMLKETENILTNGKFGGSLVQFNKTSDAPVVTTNSQILRDEIEKGVSIINYFGHSSVSNMEFSTDPPHTMNNKDKYFFFSAFGCYAGLAHGVAKAIGTSYILAENAGAIAFLSPGQYGITSALPTFCLRFYTNVSNAQYGKTIGEILMNTYTSLDTSFRHTIELTHHMTYQGDPAFIITPKPTQDYTIYAESIKTEPSIVTTAQPIFKVNFQMANIGRADNDTIKLVIKRQYPDGRIKTILIDSNITNLKYLRDFSYTLPSEGNEVAGWNKLLLTIEADNKIVELPLPQAEDNNELRLNGQKGYNFYVLSSELKIVSPINYGIVNLPKITLKAATNNAFLSSQKYFFEIDTTSRFNSPLLKKYNTIQTGGIVKMPLDFDLLENKVYYWRIAPDSIANIGFAWRNASFIYLPQYNEGWNQSHHGQYRDNNFNYININNNNQLEYERNFASFKINNFTFSTNRADFPKSTVDFVYDGVKYANAPTEYKKFNYPFKTNTGVIVLVFDSTSLNPWLNLKPGQFGSVASILYDDVWFGFNTQTVDDRATLIKFLDSIVPPNNYVGIFTIQHQQIDTSYFPMAWAADEQSPLTNNQSIFSVLEKQGAKLIRQTASKGSLPYIFMYKKNNPTYEPKEVLADSASIPFIYAEYDMKTRWTKGKINTENITNISKWEKIYWKANQIEAQDSAYLNVYGVTKLGKDSLLYRKVTSNEIDISALNPSEFPSLKLEFNTKDSLNKTSPQLEYWRVTYKGLPEAVINTTKQYVFHADTLQQGDKLRLEFTSENVTPHDMDSLLIQYKIRSQNNKETTVYQKVKPLLKNNTVVATYEFDTKNSLGKQSLNVRINPNQNQPERDTLNNFGLLEFFVKKDIKNPLIDVIIDGNHIVNGDIVSSKPLINITVKDENKFLMMDDTSLFQVYLKYPNEPKARLIDFKNSILKFYPATQSTGNKARIELTPEFTEDGSYQLLVKAKDASGNKTTDYELKDDDVGNPDFYNYKIAFEVVTKKAISNILPYPNPFTTSTQFVYTLTGNETPAYFKIQILTISGKVVREITQAELGALKIGTHKTDFVWDGTDQYGERLANGVYLYKVIAKKANGEDFEEFQNDSIDGFFKNGIGKVVLLR